MTSRVKSKESPGPTCPAFPNSEHFTSTHSPPLGQSLDRASGRPQKGFREALASLYSPNRIAQLRLRCLLRRGSQQPPPQVVSSLPFSPQSFLNTLQRDLSKGNRSHPAAAWFSISNRRKSKLLHMHQRPHTNSPVTAFQCPLLPRPPSTYPTSQQHNWQKSKPRALESQPFVHIATSTQKVLF